MKNLKRCVLLILSIALSVSMLAGCGNKKTESQNASTNETKSSEEVVESKELVVVSWGGAMQDAQREAIFKPFEEKYGIKINEVSPTDYGKLKAMVTSGNTEWDLVDVDADFVPRAIKENLIEPLDFSVIDKIDLEPSLTTEYSVGAELFSYAISYDTNLFPNGTNPKTWTEFWDVNKFSGKRSLWKYAPGTLEIALLADGVDPENLYPLDIDRAFNSLDKIKKDVQVWWTTGAQPAQLLTDKEVALAAAWNGRITSAKEQGATIDVEFNQSILMADSWVVPKGAKNKDAAMKFIAFATAPEQQAAFAKAIPYGVINSKAYELLDDEVKSKMASSPDKRPNQVMLDVDYWIENYDAVNDKFQDWMLE